MSAPFKASDLRGVPVAWSHSPFAAYDGRVYRDVRRAGMTIAEIVASVPGLPDDFATAGVVCINGEPVRHELWSRVRPKPPSEHIPVAVSLHVPLRGGGGGGSAGRKNTLALIATIAVLVGVLLISGGALAPLLGGAFAAGHIGATLLAAGVSLVGSLAIAALTPPPSLSPSQAQDQSKGSASADMNTVTLGGPIPRVCGTFRIFPPPVCEPVIEIVGENEIVTQVYALAGPHAWAKPRMAGADIASAADVTIETREGWPTDPPLTLITRQAKVNVLQAQLNRPVFNLDADPNFTDGPYRQLKDQSTPSIDLPTWTPVVSRDSPDEIWLHLYWPQGLGYPADLNNPVGMPIRLRMRRRGDAVWINLPEIHFQDNRAVLVRKALKIIWGTAPNPLPTAPTVHGPVYAYKLVPQQTLSPTTAAPSPGWVAHSNFSAGEGSDLMSASGAGNVKNVAMYADRVEFYVDAATFPKGVYEIEVRRGAAYSNNITYSGGIGTTAFGAATYQFLIGFYGGVVDFFYYQDDGGSSLNRAPFLGSGAPDQVILARVISIWNQNPVPKPGNALLCIQATNRGLSQVSAEASGYVRDWNTTLQAWADWKTTSIPAPHYRDVLAGDLTRRRVNAVDDAALVSWRQHCIDRSYTIDAIMDGRSMSDVLLLLAANGFARPAKSESWGIIQDKDRSGDTIAQVFSPRNTSNFRWEKAFADIPHGFIVTYRDASLDYIPAQTTVYRAGYDGTNAEILEAVDYIGPITQAAARARAAFDLKQAVARSTFYSCDAAAEAIVTRNGDLVALQHDVIDRQAGFAHIKTISISGGNVTGLTLDSAIPLTPPDDVFAAADFFSLNDVFSGLLGLDFLALVDVFTTTDVFADAPSEMGVSIRLKDGSVLTKAIAGAGDESATVTFLTAFADPGAPLAADCELVSGTLGREYKRLIIKAITAGKDLSAAMTFVDEAPELWAVAA